MDSGLRGDDRENRHLISGAKRFLTPDS